MVTRNPIRGSRRASKAPISSSPPVSSHCVTIKQCGQSNDLTISAGAIVGEVVGYKSGTIGTGDESYGASGLDQSSTIPSLSRLQWLLMINFLAARVTPRGKRHEFRWAHSIARLENERSV